MTEKCSSVAIRETERISKLVLSVATPDGFSAADKTGIGEGKGKTTYPDINQLTLNEYTPGQGIGSHVDTKSAFGDGLLSLTLSGGIVMEFRRVGDPSTKKLVYLPPRSLVLMSGGARHRWEYMIVSRSTDTVDGFVFRASFASV